MKKILIILNAIKYNRGSEALVRGLVKVCKQSDNENQIYLSSSEADFQKAIDIEGIDGYVNRYSYKSLMSPCRYMAAVAKLIFRNNEMAMKIKSSKIIKCAKKMDIILVIGADNYDKSYNMFDAMHNLNSILKKSISGKFYLYDTSLEKSDVTEDVIKDFNLFDKVTVRECVTYDNLKNIIKEKLEYYPDPAFLMEPQIVDLPKGWSENNMVGINLSNLILDEKYGSRDDILQAYFCLIEYVLNETKHNIVFLPHVMNGQDLSVLKVLYEKYKETKRVILIDNEKLNAPELKYIISKCKFFVGARTHATIAAYSSFVPTLVFGYSVKSIGISSDLFGTSKNYVISSKNMQEPNELKNRFIWLQQNEKIIQKQLLDKIPEYKVKAMMAKQLIK